MICNQCPTREIIIFIGKMQSGKTTAAECVEYSKYWDKTVLCECHKFATPHYDVLDVLGVPKHRSFMQDFSDLAKKHFGTEIFIDIMKENLSTELRAWKEDSDGLVLLFDDIRYPGELNTVRELAKTFDIRLTTIAIEASDEIRQARNSLTYSGQSHNSEIEIASLMAECDYTIRNESSELDFVTEIEALLKGLE